MVLTIFLACFNRRSPRRRIDACIVHLWLLTQRPWSWVQHRSNNIFVVIESPCWQVAFGILHYILIDQCVVESRIQPSSCRDNKSRNTQQPAPNTLTCSPKSIVCAFYDVVVHGLGLKKDSLTILFLVSCMELTVSWCSIGTWCLGIVTHTSSLLLRHALQQGYFWGREVGGSGPERESGQSLEAVEVGVPFTGDVLSFTLMPQLVETQSQTKLDYKIS